jgi:alkylhydroperoxidase family enzyme
VDGDAQHVITLARTWRDLPLSEADRAMLAYVEVVALTPSAATAADIDTLRTVGFGDAEIFEIVMVTAYYALRCRMADALGIEVDTRARQNAALVDAFAFREEKNRSAGDPA